MFIFSRKGKISIKRYKKYPKDEFDQLFLEVGRYLNSNYVENIEINYQKFLQCHKIARHKMEVMKINPAFNDKSWYEANFDDVLFFSFPIECKIDGNSRLLTIHLDDEKSISTSISTPMYRVLKNQTNVLFVQYENKYVIDFLPLPDDEDIRMYDEYNFKSNMVEEQFRHFRILFSQIEEEVQTTWAQYEGEIVELLGNVLFYQNRKYDYASDNTVSLLSDDDIQDFLEKEEELFSNSLLIMFDVKFKGKKMVLTNSAAEEIVFTTPLTKAFLKVLQDCCKVVLCLQNFEVKELVPLYGGQENL